MVKISRPRIKFLLQGIQAAGLYKGYCAGYIASPSKPSLHFALFIMDPYSGVTGIDGQPVKESVLNLIDVDPNKKFLLLKPNFYDQKSIEYVVQEIYITPPENMTEQEFADKLIKNANNFAKYSVRYSFPDNLGGATMDLGEYNSSSLISGLLNSVMGSVPTISTPDYQTPGWETPVPANYFK